MKHPICQVTSVEPIGPYTLRVGFDDRTSQIIDFRPVLQGELYGPLRDPDVFAQVHIDPEVSHAGLAKRSRFRPGNASRLGRVRGRYGEDGRRLVTGADLNKQVTIYTDGACVGNWCKGLFVINRRADSSQRIRLYSCRAFPTTQGRTSLP